jgi:FAD dependent oxidoreductase
MTTTKCRLIGAQCSEPLPGKLMGPKQAVVGRLSGRPSIFFYSNCSRLLRSASRRAARLRIRMEFRGRRLGWFSLEGQGVVTKPKDLRTGRSIWESERTAGIPHAPLSRDIESDVLVIGAGITGATIADALTATGLKVAVVDKRGPAKGSTTASTALLQYEIDTPLTKLSRKIGKIDAIRAWRRSRLAVDALATRVAELGVPEVVGNSSCGR